MGDIKLRPLMKLEELIIYSGIEKEDEALRLIDDINEYIDKYTGWNITEANDSIKGYDYSYVTNREGTPFIDISSVKHMLSGGISTEESKDKFSIKDLDDIKKQIIERIRLRIRETNSDNSILVCEDDTASYGDIVYSIDDVFDKLKAGKDKE